MENAGVTKKQTGYLLIMLTWLITIVVIIYLTVSNTFASPRRLLPIYCVETQEKKIALSFNAAWGDECLDDILNILDKKNVKCSFFIVGSFADDFPDAVRKIYNAGHEIGNHSLKHTDPVSLSYSEIVSDISACNDKLASLTGSSVSLYRAPSGSYNNDTIEAAQSLGMKTIQWDVDSIDWKDITAQQIYNRITEKVKNGSIVLFHVGKQNTLDALEDIIDALRQEGFSLVKVSDILLEGDCYIAPDGTQKLRSSQN